MSMHLIIEVIWKLITKFSFLEALVRKKGKRKPRSKANPLVSYSKTRYNFSPNSISHYEGGWPKDVNYGNPEQTSRYKRKIEKTEEYITQLTNLTQVKPLFCQPIFVSLAVLSPWTLITLVYSMQTNIYKLERNPVLVTDDDAYDKTE